MDQSQSVLKRLISGDLSIPFYFAIGKLLVHFITNFFGGYGYFRDELYYLACSNHLAAGYVDHPPFSIYVLKLSTLLFGDSLFGIRIVPALCGAVTVFITGIITKELGGKSYAEFLSCLCSFSLITLAMNGYYSMNSLDILCWAIVTYLVVKIVATDQSRLWIWLGVVLGLGLLNKIGVGFLGFGLLIGLLATPQRKWLITKWPYIAAGIALLIFMPYVLWNIYNDFAHLEFIHNASAGKYSSLNQTRFLSEQILINNPVAGIVWISGIVALVVMKALRPFRILLLLYIVPLAIFLFNGTSKAEYLAPAYVILWVAGSVAIEYATSTIRLKKLLRTMLPVLIVISGAFALPMVLPVLPVETFIAYSNAIGLKPENTENKTLGELPQFYADMFGWEDKAKAVADVFFGLSEHDQKICSIFSYNYGRCGAIDLFGKQNGLPPSIGLHNNYWIWGPGDATGEVMIILGGSTEDLKTRFETVEKKAIVHSAYCMPYENDVPVFVCRKLKYSINEFWSQLKNYD